MSPIQFNVQSIFSTVQNRSPAKGRNGRDNNESIDMEMSDEDFDAMPEFQSTQTTRLCRFLHTQFDFLPST